MTLSAPEQPNMNNDQLLDIVEKVSVGGAICGAIASLAFKQFVLASAAIPVSVCLSLNLINRKRLLDANTQQVTQQVTQQFTQKINDIEQQINAISQSNNQTAFAEMTQAAIAQLTQENAVIQGSLETLNGQVVEVKAQSNSLQQSISNLGIDELKKEHTTAHYELETVKTGLSELQRLANNLSQDTSHLKTSTQSLSKEQSIIGTRVNWLRDAEKYTSTVRTNPYDADAYYNRGYVYQSLGYKEAAIWDHTEAIRINPRYAKAYHERGLTHAYLGNKKAAVADLREAAKLFFEQGDIASYQQARDLSKQFHDLSSPAKTEANQEVAVACLFT